MYFLLVAVELNSWKVCDIPPFGVGSSLEMGTLLLIQVPHQVAAVGLKSSILSHATVPVWVSKVWSGLQAGPEGPAEVVVVVVGVSSSPPIIMTAARDEEHTTIRPTPATAMAAIVFYYTSRFF
jgi:hypothetical protein